MGDAVVGHAVVRHAVVRHALYTPPAVEVRVNPHPLLEDNVVAGTEDTFLLGAVTTSVRGL